MRTLRPWDTSNTYTGSAGRSAPLPRASSEKNLFSFWQHNEGLYQVLQYQAVASAAAGRYIEFQTVASDSRRRPSHGIPRLTMEQPETSHCLDAAGVAAGLRREPSLGAATGQQILARMTRLSRHQPLVESSGTTARTGPHAHAASGAIWTTWRLGELEGALYALAGSE